MKQITSAAVLGAALMIGSCILAPPAQAGYIVTLSEVGSDVVATGSGPIDLTGLSSTQGISSSPGLNPVVAFFATGMSAPINNYIGVTGPTSFGPGSQHGSGPFGLIAADSATGDIVVIHGGSGTLAVPSGYVSNNPLSDTATYLNQSFTSLGVIPGIYEWTWGPGVNQNFTLIIGAIPEPASAMLLATAIAGLLLAGAIRRRQPEA